MYTDPECYSKTKVLIRAENVKNGSGSKEEGYSRIQQNCNVTKKLNGKMNDGFFCMEFCSGFFEVGGRITEVDVCRTNH